MKITFEDWELGRITIDGTYLMIPKDLESPKIIYWNVIEEDIQIKIRKKQKQIFQELCDKELKKIISDFEKRNNKSDFKSVLLNLELKKLNEVLFETNTTNESNLRYSWGCISPFNLDIPIIIDEIRKYIQLHYVEGFEMGFDFINSPLSPYSIPHDSYYELMSEVQGEVLYQFYRYLLDLKSNSGVPFDKKLWNTKAFELFKFLSKEYKQDKVLSKYNLIYHFLKKLNEEEFENYQFSMRKKDYYEFITKSINPEFQSLSNGIPSMNPPETDEKNKAFKNLEILRKQFEQKSYTDITLNIS